MLQRFVGKKLLILGGSAHEISLVQRAQELGCYVIVTDYYTDWNLSPAKGVADEVWDISWSDLDSLEYACKKSGVDGILAGYSEFRVENLILLCERLGLPCYSTMKQLEITRDKVRFKNICRKNQVPTIKEYATIEEVNAFPVIVKPVDRGGSIGIGIAKNAEELRNAYSYAMEMSVNKQVIIEQFIDKGTKIDVYYAVSDGEIVYLADDDTINAENNGYERVVQSGWLFPSRYHDVIVSTVDQKLRNLIHDIGIRNGYISFSGFMNPDGSIAFFETGFRLTGEHVYNFVAKKGIVNVLDILICFALLGEVPATVWGEDLCPELKCAAINFYAKEGVVAEIEGFTKIQEMDDCSLVLISGHVGQVCHDDKAILSKMAMVHVCSESPQQLEKDVREIYSRVTVRDEFGADMIYHRINGDVLSGWWETEK